MVVIDINQEFQTARCSAFYKRSPTLRQSYSATRDTMVARTCLMSSLKQVALC